jgi:hypothetical protein
MQIMKKPIHNFSFAAVIMAVLCAGTVSARQLKTGAQAFPGACGTTCSATVHCGGLCTSWIDSGKTTGFCAQDPPAAKPRTK